KLTAARAAAASAESNARAPGSAKKSAAAIRMMGGAEVAAAAQAAQLKEDLYRDLTGLIIRNVKREEEEDVFDCIQTGRNGTLHFKFGLPNDKNADYDESQCHYVPQMDPSRDEELKDLLPEYMSEELTFPRPQVDKFYARVVKALTEKPITVLDMARVTRFGFLATAVVFHLVYIFSIFDIYFVSPIVSGMHQFEIERPKDVEAPAKRLVLYVGDGLRADTAFKSYPDPYPTSPADEEPRHLAPFLRSRVLEHGTFGVSHTRVPTESRPGHVALIAGLYEDVSAVTTGWKLNPVNFDSVFNRSRHTWSWGSPDILPMFQEGAEPGRVDGDTYGHEFEDFSMDATLLDIWVFDRVKALFAEAATNATLNAQLRQDKLVFFLHLLGLDTSGHAYGPHSKEYLYNLQVVDKGVQEITTLIEEFYADDKTAFVFTADHGMSDFGSHGDGHPDNTRTPLIAWGSGVAKPVKVEEDVAPGHDDFSLIWDLDKIQRHDVAQADVAALMSYLAGLAFPVNSVGELPLSFLAADMTEKAEAALVNAQAILEMYRVKEEQKQANQLRYVPYSGLGADDAVAARIADIRSLIDANRPEDAIRATAELVQHGLQGLRYLQTYDWLFLRALITVGYVGWIAFALTTVIDLHVLHGATETSRSLTSVVFFASVLVALYASFIASKSPMTYYLYALFPVAFWEEVYARRKSLAAGRKALFAQVKGAGGWAAVVVQGVLAMVFLEALALGYTHREIFSGLFVLAAVWPFCYGSKFISDNRLLIFTWIASCLAMSTFTLLPVVKVEDITQILYGGTLMVIIGLLYLFFEFVLLRESALDGENVTARPANPTSRIMIGVQIGLIILAMIVTRSSALSLQAKQGLPRGEQVLGWTILVLSLLMPFMHRLSPNNHYLHRLVVLFLTFSPIFVILSISYEGLFYFVFCVLLVTWVRMEHKIYVSSAPAPAAASAEPKTPAKGKGKTAKGRKSNGKAEPDALLPASLAATPYRSLSLPDLRVSLFFLALLQSAFFSTGNIASISSFSLVSVYRLLPVFDPFSQGGLLLLKLLIPFALISANLGVLNKRLGVAPSALFMLVMGVGDCLTVHFFWTVRDEGSWLEIGSTISHFVIASLLGVFVAALEGVSEIFIGGVEV
ncbi:hypothetical protein O988_06906, partial [Pseudogymnoascus sp. VKM F-3808]